jgi:hypothetical protein
MTIRMRALLLWLLVYANFTAGAAFAFWIDDRLAAVSFTATFVFAILLATVRCPRCRQYVFKKRATFAGTEWDYWGGRVPKSCAKCRLEFT